MSRNKFIIPLSLLLFANLSFADNVLNSSNASTAVRNTAVNSTQVDNPTNWGLTATEWGRYQHFMQGPARLWYPQLSPPAILGLMAETPEEQRHFAAIVAQEEHDKLARELVFNNAVHQAVLRLYPKESVIQPFDFSAFNGKQ